MPAPECGARLQELGIKLWDLRQREGDLKETSAAERYFGSPTAARPSMREIELTFDEGTPEQRTALMRKLVHEIPTDGRRVAQVPSSYGEGSDCGNFGGPTVQQSEPPERIRG